MNLSIPSQRCSFCKQESDFLRPAFLLQHTVACGPWPIISSWIWASRTFSCRCSTVFATLFSCSTLIGRSERFTALSTISSHQPPSQQTFSPSWPFRSTGNFSFVVFEKSRGVLLVLRLELKIRGMEWNGQKFQRIFFLIFFNFFSMYSKNWDETW